MRRTSSLAIAGLVIAAGLVGWLLEAMLVMTGRAALVPPLTLGPALAILGGVLLLVAWPVRQAAQRKRRIDYRHATSVLGFAKASSTVGALVAGFALGAIGFFATRSVVADQALLALSVVTVGALLQLAAGLLAELWCVLPPDDDETAPGASAPEPA
ncbi:DUF3180 domain-containing protein [Agrococcus sp. HG114]|uniref:DUF3180 domain-containing protein n=1 Tax=Agrococcus sp. HG114 TaxID=2969757 RepID=UPI00215B1D79|nr:DUF3180 domain-containing protein [Agrococcus sp. HG114]MCR8670058.1 DUF3180 domain-containing protein [Agrococcus sp. HG114]